MTPAQFLSKWRNVELKERSAAQEHFLDLCRLMEHPTPAEADPTGVTFCFEKGAAKQDGGDGYADVWKRSHFAIEYKGRHKDLGAAYAQLLQYREALENPPLLVTCDLDRIVVHTNFTATAKQVHEISLESLGEPRSLEVLRALFHDPEKLRPGRTSEAVTAEAAIRFTEIAASMRERQLDAGEIAHFLNRIIFCLFAEDIGLLPDNLFSRLAEKSAKDPARFGQLVGQLFGAMAQGGDFGLDTIAHFNGGLFQDAAILELTTDEISEIVAAGRLDWASIDPSILGTLFERGLDPAKRSQLGAHYTSREDIEMLIEPVVMRPLRREWEEIRAIVDFLLTTGSKKPGAPPPKKPLTPARIKKAHREADRIIHRFLERLQHVTVLDPACGSGNFLYVTLQKLKGLEKEVIVHGLECGFTGFLPLVGPWQLYGIELNPFAFDLAQTSIWIGHLQWTRANGFKVPQDPVLRPMEKNFRHMDAIVERRPDGSLSEPEWPATEFIVGNPPFLGGKILRTELGDDYVDSMFKCWKGRVTAESDLCCYWFEKARGHLANGKVKRVGLLATQGIRGGANRKVLKQIKESGEIFFAISDREWILDGAHVHISMVSFDSGADEERFLDGKPVPEIHSNLTADSIDLTRAARIFDNSGMAFMGSTKGGAFDINEATALQWLAAPNPHGVPNSEVVVPWINGMDVTRRPREMWIIDYKGRDEPEASRFEAPFAHIQEHVLPKRRKNKREFSRSPWWLHYRARPAMLDALRPLDRFIVTTTVSKHRLFAWAAAPTNPDHQLIVFARADDYFFGVLHSKVHERWALAQGTQLREKESGFRYTPTTCFETFPFPEPSAEQHNAVAVAARELDQLRERWLNPPEWTREEAIEFPATPSGPWARFVAPGTTTARYPRRVPIDDAHATKLKKRTLTNLYNERPAWLEHAHAALDAAVMQAYGWPADLPDAEILSRLLALNLASGPSEVSKAVVDPKGEKK